MKYLIYNIEFGLSPMIVQIIEEKNGWIYCKSIPDNYGNIRYVKEYFDSLKKEILN